MDVPPSPIAVRRLDAIEAIEQRSVPLPPSVAEPPASVAPPIQQRSLGELLWGTFSNCAMCCCDLSSEYDGEVGRPNVQVTIEPQTFVYNTPGVSSPNSCSSDEDGTFRAIDGTAWKRHRGCGENKPLLGNVQKPPMNYGTGWTGSEATTRARVMKHKPSIPKFSKRPKFIEPSLPRPVPPKVKDSIFKIPALPQKRQTPAPHDDPRGKKLSRGVPIVDENQPPSRNAPLPKAAPPFFMAFGDFRKTSADSKASGNQPRTHETSLSASKNTTSSSASFRQSLGDEPLFQTNKPDIYGSLTSSKYPPHPPSSLGTTYPEFSRTSSNFQSTVSTFENSSFLLPENSIRASSKAPSVRMTPQQAQAGMETLACLWPAVGLRGSDDSEDEVSASEGESVPASDTKSPSSSIVARFFDTRE